MVFSCSVSSGLPLLCCFRVFDSFAASAHQQCFLWFFFFFFLLLLDSSTGTITHVEVGNLVTMWLQLVVVIIIWKFPY
jgi:hypothetical protein